MGTRDGEQREGAGWRGSSGVHRVVRRPLEGVRCLIVEDEEILAKGEARLFASVGMETARASSVKEALAALAAGVFDLIAVDLCLPDGHGILVVKAALALAERPAILALSGHPELLADIEVQTLADMCVPKLEPADHIIGSALAALRKAGRLPPGCGDIALELTEIPDDDPRFTPMQGQVVRLLVQGEGYEAIAERLGIRPVTARSHAQGAYKKLGTSNYREFVAALVKQSK